MDSINKKSSSSSSVRAISTDISHSLSPHLPIVHCFQQVLKATSRIGTKLFYVVSSWTSCLCSSMWRGPQEYITHELVPTSSAVSRMSGLSNFDSFRDGWWVAVDTDNLDIVAGILQADTLAPYLFIICLDYVLTTSIEKIKENCFKLTKEINRKYPAKTISDADYADDIVLLANAPDQAETLLHSLERAAAGIGLHVNAHETEYMCFNQTGDISTLNDSALKLVDMFTYLGSSVSSTEIDFDTRLAKALTAIYRLSIIWNSDLTDKMKRGFFQAVVLSILLYRRNTWTLNKGMKKKLDGN